MKNIAISVVSMTALILPALAFAKKPHLKKGEVHLTLNAPLIDEKTGELNSDRTTPRNWRTTHGEYIKDRIISGKIIPKTGLKDLKMSGSGEFSRGQFMKLLETLPQKKDVLVVDLREEPHGFLNHFAVSWFGQDDGINAGKSRDFILEDESKRIQALRKTRFTYLRSWIPKKDDLVAVDTRVDVQEALTEKELLAKFNVDYLRLPIPDYQRPTDSSVDEIVRLYQTLPSTKWVHFHCAAGQGRTTTAMALFDMMKNAKSLSAPDILERQRLLGGTELFAPTKKSAKRAKWAKERTAFLLRFYDYAKEQSPLFNTPWSIWVKRHPIQPNIPR